MAIPSFKSRNQAAKSLGLTTSAIYRLGADKTSLSLDGWIRISKGLQLDLPDLLLKAPSELSPRASFSPPPPRYFSGAGSDPADLRRQFLEIFAKDPSLTLNKAALRLNISVVRIINLCPKQGRVLIAQKKATLLKARSGKISKGLIFWSLVLKRIQRPLTTTSSA